MKKLEQDKERKSEIMTFSRRQKDVNGKRIRNKCVIGRLENTG